MKSANNQLPLLVPAVIILAGLVAFNFFWGLGNIGLVERPETRVGEIAREMAVSGDWLVPRINCRPYLTKPALYHWLAASFIKLGGSNEWMVRLPSALAALGGVIIVFLLGSSLSGQKVGLVAAGLLASSPKYVDMARTAQTDMLLTFFISLSLLFFLKSYRSEKPVFKLILFFVFAGLATLTKGPLGLIIPLGVAGIFIISLRKLSKVKLPHYLAGLVIFLALTLPWYLAVSWKTAGTFGHEFFLKQNLARFFDYRHGEPPWYYIPALILGFFPWSFFLPAGILSGWRAFRGGQKGFLFALVWFLAVFLIFSISAGKRPDYILPLYPAAALLAALTWRGLFSSDESGRRPVGISYLFLAVTVLIALASAAGALFSYMNWTEPYLAFFGRMMRPKELLLLSSAMAGAAEYALWLFVGFAVLAGLVITPLFLSSRGKAIGMATASLGLVIIILNLNIHYFVPRFDKAASPKAFYRRVASLAPLDKLKVSGFPYFGLYFYAGSCLEELSPSQARAYLAEPREGYIATTGGKERERDLEGFPVVDRFVNKEGKELVILSGSDQRR